MALKAAVAEAEEAAKAAQRQRDEAILPIGNLVHDSVPVDDDEVCPPPPSRLPAARTPTISCKRSHTAARRAGA